MNVRRTAPARTGRRQRTCEPPDAEPLEEHDAGRHLVSEGRAGYAFYVLDQGRATVTQDGKELPVLGPGEFFGEIAIIGEGRRAATVTAREPVVVWCSAACSVSWSRATQTWPPHSNGP